MHRYKKSSKKRGILRAGALLGGMLIFMNVNAAPMSGAGGNVKTTVLDQEVKVERTQDPLGPRPRHRSR